MTPESRRAIAPKTLDGAEVLCWVYKETGAFYEIKGVDPPIPVAAMVIARYVDNGAVYLFKCDPQWQVVQDWNCDSVEEARVLAQMWAGDEPLTWQQHAFSSPTQIM